MRHCRQVPNIHTLDNANTYTRYTFAHTSAIRLHIQVLVAVDYDYKSLPQFCKAGQTVRRGKISCNLKKKKKVK